MVYYSTATGYNLRSVGTVKIDNRTIWLIVAGYTPPRPVYGQLWPRIKR